MGSRDEKYSCCYQEMTGNEKTITRNSKFRKPQPPLVTEAHDISHSSLLQMWIFRLVSNKVFDMFSKCRRFQAPCGLIVLSAHIAGCDWRHLGKGE